jgi:CAAX protease family protein
VKHLPFYLLLFIPVFGAVWIVSDMPTFQKTYPFYHNPAGLKYLLIWELCYAIQFFSLEFFFRGFMMMGWREKIGWLAVPIMVIPYCMIHFPKPGLEATGAIIAGSVLGIVALRTKSIWGGVAIHVTVAWTMDILSLWRKGWFDGML